MISGISKVGFDLGYKLSYGSSTFEGITLSQRANTKFIQLNQLSASQSELFSRLSGQNFGELLLKEKNSATRLTAEERAYLTTWKQPEIVRIATLGLVLRYGTAISALNVVRNAL